MLTFSSSDRFLRTLPDHDLSVKDDLMKFAIPGENCLRKCIKNDQKVCHFEFRLEHYQVLGGFVNYILLKSDM
jgi:hypothetical protein